MAAKTLQLDHAPMVVGNSPSNGRIQSHGRRLCTADVNRSQKKELGIAKVYK